LWRVAWSIALGAKRPKTPGIANILLALLLLTPALLGQDKKEGEKKADAAAEKPAVITFRLREDAKLFIDGKEYKNQYGMSERKFETPPLKPGVRYHYDAKAVWEPNNYTKITRPRKILVEAGKGVEVDFSNEDPKQKDDIFVRYVPTPQEVVDGMLKLGKVGKDDVVYDLGCGDGRIPITAVARYGAKRGVGIDLDPQRIKESKENAKLAGVEGKVDFRQENVLKLKDLGDATVVTLYLGDDLNKQLRPILQKTLKPGSRIVSHRFLIGDWKPDKTEELVVHGGRIQIHLWTIKGEEKKD
jgi:uncharacterized protein (TIGR03000 family)